MADKKYTKVFAFDGESMVSKGVVVHDTELKKALDIARERNIPIVSTKEYATEPLPIRDIVGRFGSSFFMPTMSYMIAYAIFLGYDQLFLHGIDQGPSWIYQFGKSHIIFWLGFAVAKRLDVRLGRGSLRWAYSTGLDTFPRAFMEQEGCDIADSLITG